jgi:hypothetical protein
MHASPDDHCVYLGRADLEALDVPQPVIDNLIAMTPHTGHGGQPVVTRDQLDAAMATWRAAPGQEEGDRP